MDTCSTSWFEHWEYRNSLARANLVKIGPRLLLSKIYDNRTKYLGSEQEIASAGMQYREVSIFLFETVVV